MLYEVLLEVEGTVRLTVEAQNEEEAARKARREAEIGGCPSDADYSVLWVTMKDAA